MGKIFHFLRLMRPANIVTSVADVLAGITISGYIFGPEIDFLAIILLCLSTIGLYGGGIVFNDVFDFELDKIERPERAIPSGAVKLSEAIVLGLFLLVFGIASAFLYSMLSGIIAILIAVCALVYNKFSKHHPFIGPLNMGICRGLNLLLGVSIIAYSLNNSYIIAVVHLIYIFSITIISRGEVHGSNKNKLFLGAFLYALVIGVMLFFAWQKEQILLALIFIVPFAWMIFRPLFRAIQEPIGKNIGLAVKAGVISLILMDAAWAAVFGSLGLAFFIVILLPLSIWLSKRFAVT
ncbi:UbiA-like protein EboC [Daejeonella sp.]|uniref:UbiA-like protein EboC n=1 Tax=Daejeonella sp. TaxID=2805397 RepID=UPI0025B814B9|nr:UbiA-like protein EboC [Daejeonella sp.]